MVSRNKRALQYDGNTSPAATTNSPELVSPSRVRTEQATEVDHGRLHGKRVGIVVLSAYPFDPRPRRTAAVLMQHGMSVDYICVADGKARWHERTNGIDVFRVPIEHQRGGKLGYAYQYSAFTVVSAAILAARSLRRRYDLIYINNMPDMLVVSALLPKMFGAKVILDLHDPMPELMMTIFGKNRESRSVQLLKFLERWSMACAHQILTPNIAFKRLFASRSCREEKIEVIMNSPDESIFPFRPACVPAVNAKSNKPIVVMYHGTLVERNGLDVAVDAFAYLRNKLPAAQLHIYGKSTPFLERAMQSARERGLQQSVLYLGEKPLEQIVGAIDVCDAGVVPNPRNAFTDMNMPTRIFEYLARGKPVIAPRTAGIRDYFDEHSLLFFEAGDAKDLAQTIQFAACYPEEAYTITQRGQQVYKQHAWKQESETLVRLVGKLFESHSAASVLSTGNQNE
ncbi:MAG TPA: glycosyltransferase family 4 protein [Candidatus Angelobacter sp.]